MRMRHLKVAVVLLAGVLLTNSCVGSFSLFNKLATWNKSATSERFLNELIFLIISPAYAVCSVVDALVLNTIEFWSGSNPVAQRVGKTVEVQGQDGRYYAVTTLKDGYSIKKPTGEVIKFIYNKDTKTWQEEENGIVTDLFRFNDDGIHHQVRHFAVGRRDFITVLQRLQCLHSLAHELAVGGVDIV